MCFCKLIVSLLLSAFALNAEAEDARSMLTATLAKYANLSTYYIEGTRESTTTGEVQRNWQQERFTLAKAAGNRYHYDIKAPDQWNLVVADGTVEWTLQPWEGEYTRRPLSTPTAKSSDPDDAVPDFVARAAQHYIEDPAHYKIQTADFLPEESLIFAGKHLPCYVIRATYKPSEEMPVPKHVTQWTFWIEEERRLIRKEMLEVRDSTSVLQPLHKVDQTYTTYYTTVDLEGAPPAALFTFTPPSGASQVRRLFVNDRTIDLTGFPAPPLKLKTLDGKVFDSTSLKGHTAIVEFWASWCVPCVQQMKGLAKLADELGKTGLFIIGVNIYDDTNAAIEFLNQHRYGWTNLRGDSDTATAWMLNGVPLVAVIDPEGRIAYYHNGYEQPEETAIVEVLRKINPSFGTIPTPRESFVDTR
jgi:thiol-disulfide isomerase/thioredoxin